MSVDFTRYPFADKTIRVSYDAQEKKHWFVIEDVMCTIFSNGKKYWAELKKEIMAAGMTSPNAFVTSGSKQGAIDVADCNQMLNILSFIPNRKAKKERVTFWLKNHTEKNKKAKEVTTMHYECKKVVTEVKRNNIDKEEDNERALWGCFISVAVAIIAIICEEKGLLNFGILLLICIAVFVGCVYYCEKNHNVTNYITKYYHSFKRKNSIEISREIIRNVKSILKKRLLTFDERENFIKEAVKNGTPEWKISDFLDIELRQWIRLHPKKTVTRCIKCNNAFPEEIEQCPFCGKMQIWPHIKKLTALALSDRVLTDLERKTIVNKAVQNGISSEEINQYLDDQLNLRLESYTKVDLRDCPYCGAQIPLISDECMYCGKPLEHIVGSTNTAFNITGSEADIIRSENQRVEQERHGIKNCPDCGAPFPLISNICESCGHVLHERDENSLNIKNLLNNIQRSIERVTDAPKPKVYQIIGYWFYYIILILSIFAFIIGIITDSEAGKFISLTGFVASIIAMGTNAVLSDTKSPVLIADGEYYKARHSYEMYAREVDTLYGDDYEAQTLLSHFSTALKRLKRERYQNRIKVIRIILISALVIMGVITYFSTKDDNNTEPAPKNSEEITMPPNTEWMLNFSKELKPYPPESGIQDSLLSRFLRADKGTELSFVMSEFNKQPVFHWKVSQLELLPGDSTDYYRTFNYRKIGIQLLDSNYLHISTLGEYVVNPFLPQENYNTVIRSGKGHFYIDFWSKHSTSDERILHLISEKAVYYSIYSSNY